MPSDLENQEETPKKSSGRILRHEVQEGLEALNRSTTRLFLSGLSAGLDLGFSLFLIGSIQTMADGQLTDALLHLLLAAAYSLGFILVVVGRSELFTEQTTLAVMPLLVGRTTFLSVARLWGIVYVANLLGGAAFAWIAVQTGPPLKAIDLEVFHEIARGVVEHPPEVMFLSGILAGWLMGLLSWLVAAGRDTISQIVIVGLITSSIALGHLHHSILGSVEVLAGIFSGADVSFGQFGTFLLFTTLGNAVGGTVFVAAVKYGTAWPDEGEQFEGEERETADAG